MCLHVCLKVNGKLMSMKNQAGILRKVGNVFPVSVKKLCEMYSTFTPFLRIYFTWGIQFTEKQKNKVNLFLLTSKTAVCCAN